MRRPSSRFPNDIPPLVVMSVGMTFILIIGGIDLSVGSVMARRPPCCPWPWCAGGWPLYAAAPLGVVVAALCGTLTGMVSVHWRIPSFIVSLGVLEIARGLAYQVTNSRTELHRQRGGRDQLADSVRHVAGLPVGHRPS